MNVPKLIVDPPSGWKYGFPKEYTLDTTMMTDEEYEVANTAWYIYNGYPESLIKQGMLKYGRSWYAED